MSEEKKDNRDLAEELRELGEQVEKLVRSSLASERAKELRNDIAKGMQEIGTQMQSAIKTIGDNPKVQEFAERGQQAVDQARESKAMQDFQEALARGIAQLNEQLSNFASRVTQSPSSDSEPNTGATTRLDPDKDK